MEAIQTTAYKGRQINIYYDETAESPRCWDNLGTIYSNSLRYSPDGVSIDDLMDESGINQFEGLDHLIAQLSKNYIAMRVCIVDHGYKALSLHRPVPNPYMGFDSGTFGIIAVKKEDVRREYGVKRITQSVRERVESVFQAEISALQSCMNGEVYGYVVDDDGDSCWGFYSMEEAEDEAKSVIDFQVKNCAA